MAAAAKSRKNAKLFRYATYYRKFVKRFAHIAANLNRKLKNEEGYIWSPDCEAAFEALKTASNKIMTLAHSDFKKTFTVDSDASEYGI